VAARARDLRLTRDQDIRALFRTGRRTQSGPLRVVYRRTDRGHPRLGVQVSRRSARAAVTRNRIRRRVREAFRPLLAGCEEGVDLMVMAGPEAATLPWDELAARCRRLVERIVQGESEPNHPHPA
jgi:ribonuclease P protein component